MLKLNSKCYYHLELSTFVETKEKDMSVKIQINNLQALERLLAGDPAIELEVRQSAITEYSKKYVKTMLNDEEIRKAIYERLFTTVPAKDRYGSPVKVFVPEVAELFNEVLANHFWITVKLAISQHMDQLINVEIAKRLQNIKTT